jgi:hypothetical protein
MKARTREKEMGAHRSGDSVEVTVRPLESAVAIALCPELEAYLSGKKWPIAERESKRTIIATKLAQDRLDHAVHFQVKKMRRSISSRKRLRGENRKEKILDLAKDLAIRHYVSKDDPPDFLIGMAAENHDLNLSRRAARAHVKGVNPLFDDVDYTILFCWDRLHSIFEWPFSGFAYVEHELPGLSKWRDAAAALFIAYVAKDETFYSQAARPTKEHPNRRPYYRYKGRRKNLDLHPDKRPVITRAHWDRHEDILCVASKADGWGWQIVRFNRRSTITGTVRRFSRRKPMGGDGKCTDLIPTRHR